MTEPVGITDDLRILTTWCTLRSEPPRLELRCAEADDAPATCTTVRLTGCLADADLESLARVVAVTGLLRLRVDLCQGGPAAAGQLQDALAALGVDDRMVLGPGGATSDARLGSHHVRSLPARRRGLVGWFLPQDGPVAPAEAEERSLVDALRVVVGERAVPEDAPTVSSPALELISSGCTACNTCVRACPSDALALERDDEVVRLAYRAAGCIGCNQCIDLCPADALDAPVLLSWPALLARDDVVVLEEMVTRQCERCRATFSGGVGDLCEVCAARRANPFASMLPPHVQALLDRRN